MPDDKSENELPQFDREEFRVRVEDGFPVLVLPNCQEVRLRVHVMEWTYNEPRMGENVAMDVETDSDFDYAWWSLQPERADVMAGDTRDNFPQVSIEPEIHTPGDSDE